MGASGMATYWDRSIPVLDELAVLRARLQLGALLFGLSVRSSPWSTCTGRPTTCRGCGASRSPAWD
jgi:hypothetical protein